MQMMYGSGLMYGGWPQRTCCRLTVVVLPSGGTLYARVWVAAQADMLLHAGH
jgi:hypothetical protein